MQAQHPSSSSTKAITNLPAIGDRVSYIELTSEGRGYRFSARKGVITEINGQVATVRAGNGRQITHPLNKLTPEDQPNALTRMLTGEQ